MMGKEDMITNEYMCSPERVADLLNGYVYGGEKKVKPGEVKDLRNVLGRWEPGSIHKTGRGNRSKKYRAGYPPQVQTVTADVVLEVGSDMQAMIVVLEDQTDIHYALIKKRF